MKAAPILNKFDEEKYKKELIMARSTQLLYASGGTDVMITDYMKGHRYGVFNPQIQLTRLWTANSLRFDSAMSRFILATLLLLSALDVATADCQSYRS